MEKNNKIRISSNPIVLNIALFAVICFLIKRLINNYTSDVDYDFKTFAEYKIAVIVFLGFLIYFLVRPSVYYDDTNLYIKKINKKQTTIPLKNIHSIFDNPFTGYGWGSSLISIEYLEANEKISFKFNFTNGSDKKTDFMGYVKQVNPKVEIV